MSPSERRVGISTSLTAVFTLEGADLCYGKGVGRRRVAHRPRDTSRETGQEQIDDGKSITG